MGQRLVKLSSSYGISVTLQLDEYGFTEGYGDIYNDFPYKGITKTPKRKIDLNTIVRENSKRKSKRS